MGFNEHDVVAAGVEDRIEQFRHFVAAVYDHDLLSRDIICSAVTAAWRCACQVQRELVSIWSVSPTLAVDSGIVPSRSRPKTSNHRVKLVLSFP